MGLFQSKIFIRMYIFDMKKLFIIADEIKFTVDKLSKTAPKSTV